MEQQFGGRLLNNWRFTWTLVRTVSSPDWTNTPLTGLTLVCFSHDLLLKSVFSLLGSGVLQQGESFVWDVSHTLALKGKYTHTHTHVQIHRFWMQTHVPKHSSFLRPSLDQSSTSRMLWPSKNWFIVNLSLHWGLETLQWFWIGNEDRKWSLKILDKNWGDYLEIHVCLWTLRVANSDDR